MKEIRILCTMHQIQKFARYPAVAGVFLCIFRAAAGERISQATDYHA